MYGMVVFNSLRTMKTGATRSIRLATPSLRNRGVHLDFVASRSILHFLTSLSRTKRLCYDFMLFNGLASIGSQSHFGYRLWQLGRLSGRPTLIYWHETDWVLEQHRRQAPASARRVDRIAADPATVHLTASLACSESIRNSYPQARTIELYECSAIPKLLDHPALPAEPPTVVNLASIQERKGTDLFVETAIKVCRQHPTVEFVWLGDGEPFGLWQADVERAGQQKRILFPGYVDAGYMLLRRASLLFLSSRDDPFPLSVLEAMCLGRNVVVFDVGGAPEALAGLGHVIPPFDTDLAAEAILDCLRLPPKERLSLDLRQRYLDLYTPDRLAARLTKVLKEQIGHEH
jgi:glycosyltransferase involved in cell wall biosynthesis